jgi:hypothetical protein
MHGLNNRKRRDDHAWNTQEQFARDAQPIATVRCEGISHGDPCDLADAEPKRTKGAHGGRGRRRRGRGGHRSHRDA